MIKSTGSIDTRLDDFISFQHALVDTGGKSVQRRVRYFASPYSGYTVVHCSSLIVVQLERYNRGKSIAEPGAFTSSGSSRVRLVVLFTMRQVGTDRQGGRTP